jgi:predicted Zn-dependent protease with MMP-like domain/predicted Zn-dependent protease
MKTQDDESGETGEPTDPRLDRAWQLLEAGDVAGARRAVAPLEQESPEVLLALAACCREEDDTAQAMAILRRAAAADPEWAVPEMWLAEILITEPDAAPQALRHATRALELAEDEGDYLSAVALKAGIELELGEPDDARKTLAELPPPEVALEDLDTTLEIADLHLALGEAALARARLRTLTAAHPEAADAWHALGCAAWELNDEREMREAWKRTWTLDTAPGARGGEERLSEDEIAAVSEAALEELPARARALLQGVPIVIGEQPVEADVDAGFDPRALGLFSGTAHPDDSSLGGQPGLTQIVLFRRCLERVAGSEDELREEIRTTLLHETGHFFGMDDADLEEVGLG